MRIRKRPPTHPGGILKRQYIEPLSLTISELANTLGVSRKTLSKIVNENGSITLEYFNVKIDFRNATCGADFKS
jgi:addiction module HigA family antidote